MTFLKFLLQQKFRLSVFLLFSGLILGLGSCDYNRLYEQYRPIEDHVWHYDQPVTFDVDIEDAATKYNLFLDLRHKNNYPYNNIWMMVATIDPNADTNKLQNEFSLADKRGRWKGQNVGSVYDHRFLVRKNFRFKHSGTYQFQIQHLMRKDRLEGVMDVGLRVEEVR